MYANNIWLSEKSFVWLKLDVFLFLFKTCDMKRESNFSRNFDSTFNKLNK